MQPYSQSCWIKLCNQPKLPYFYQVQFPLVLFLSDFKKFLVSAPNASSTAWHQRKSRDVQNCWQDITIIGHICSWIVFNDQWPASKDKSKLIWQLLWLIKPKNNDVSIVGDACYNINKWTYWSQQGVNASITCVGISGLLLKIVLC